MFTPHEQNVGQNQNTKIKNYCFESVGELTYRHRASCILGHAFHYSPENAFYIFN